VIPWIPALCKPNEWRKIARVFLIFEGFLCGSVSCGGFCFKGWEKTNQCFQVAQVFLSLKVFSVPLCLCGGFFLAKSKNGGRFSL
jgi:hypothetical protein